MPLRMKDCFLSVRAKDHALMRLETRNDCHDIPLGKRRGFWLMERGFGGLIIPRLCGN